MLDFIEMISAIGVLYNHVKDYLTEEDFWPLTKAQYAKLPAEQQSQAWFMINPSKLREAKVKLRDARIEICLVSQSEKEAVLRAIKFIHKTSSDLPETSSFLERLLYAKKTLPSVVFKKDTRNH